jgi:predicted dehydrogenase
LRSAPSRFLIVSLGSIGRRHLQNLRARYPEANIAALRLTDAPRKDAVDGVDVMLTNLDDALVFRPDAAIIACPASAHEAIACALAKQGVHLLIEKPLAMTASSARTIADCCAASGVVCMVGYNLRFKQSFLELRRLLETGAIGKALSVRAEVGQYLPSWRSGQDYRTGVSARRALGGGALLELSHEIDYLIGLFGMPANVQCMMGLYSDLELDAEDVVELTLGYDDPRMIANVHLDFLQHRPVRLCRIIGSHGTLLWDAIADTITLVSADDPARAQFFGPFQTDGNASYLDEITAFTGAICAGAATSPTGSDGLNVMLVVDAAREAAKTGATVALGNINGE